MPADCPFCGKEYQLPKALRNHIGQSKLHRDEVTALAEKQGKKKAELVKELVAEAFKDKAGEGKKKREISLEKGKVGVDLPPKEKPGAADNPPDEDDFTCGDCGANVKEGANFCPGCGAPLDWDAIE